MRANRRAVFMGAKAPLVVSYTGAYTDTVVTMSGVPYRLLTLTGSGTLTVNRPVSADVWMCGGGTSGKGSKNYYGCGGAGSYTKQQSTTLSGSIAATIGAGGGAISMSGYYTGGVSSLGSISNNPQTLDSHNMPKGGTGGGSGAGAFICTGDGLTKYPFGDNSVFAHPHCAGGGGGGKYTNDEGSITYSSGGAGGTNGGDGFDDVLDSSGLGGIGGNYGGGNGQNYDRSSTNHNAYYYGAAGGGAGVKATYDTSWSYTNGDHGAGYQGIIYIRIPAAA